MVEISKLEDMRRFFQTGATQTVSFRKQQLAILKKAILQYEEQLYAALDADLKKNREEAWVTEMGMVLAELKATRKHLAAWMQPEQVSTNLLNLPSQSQLMHEPMGVVLIIAPWNYPFQLLINPLVGAIAAGNCVVLKPSEFAPATDAVMKQMISEAFPPEYIRYVQGEGHTVVPAMLEGFRFDHIFYTGSTGVGKTIYQLAASKLVPVTLELGGKSPCVVAADANLKVAAKRIAGTKFSNAGQMCVAPDYVLVHASRKQEFVETMKQTLAKFFGNDASDSYNYGRIINAKQFDRIAGYLQEAPILYGGTTDRAKLYIQPTLLDEPPAGSRVMEDEIFGPVLPIISFQDNEEALRIIAAHPNPLAFYIYAHSRVIQDEWLRAVPAGGACVNNSSWHLTNHHLPFGGRGNSGIGNYHGRYSFETFSHRKAVLRTPTWFDPSIRYPPFKGRLGLFKKIIG